MGVSRSACARTISQSAASPGQAGIEAMAPARMSCSRRTAPATPSSATALGRPCASSCRAGELVSFSYSEATLVARLDGEGRSVTLLDCFAGDAVPITIAFRSGP